MYGKSGKGVGSKAYNYGFSDITFLSKCVKVGGGSQIIGLFECTYFMDGLKKYKQARKTDNVLSLKEKKEANGFKIGVQKYA